MDLFTPKNRLAVSVAVGLSVATLALGMSACAPAHHRHVDSRGQVTSAPVSGYGYYDNNYAYYDPYRYGSHRGYYRPDYYRSGDYYRRSNYGCDRNTDPYRNIGFENGYTYGYAPCHRDRYYYSGY